MPTSWTEQSESTTAWDSSPEAFHDFLLLENGDFLLQENGDRIILEQSQASETWTAQDESSAPVYTNQSES